MSRLIKTVNNISIYEVLCSDSRVQLEHFLEIYAELFPQYAHYTNRMRRRAEFPENHRAGHILHYWLIDVDGVPAGIQSFRYVHHRQYGLAIALAIRPQFRAITVNNQRLSAFILHQALEQIIQDSMFMGELPAIGMVCEVESYRLMQKYIEIGFIELPVHYMEPIFPPEQTTPSHVDEANLLHFCPVKLGFLKNPAIDTNLNDPELIKSFVLTFLVEHYNLPENHPIVQQTIASIPVFS